MGCPWGSDDFRVILLEESDLVHSEVLPTGFFYFHRVRMRRDENWLLAGGLPQEL